ncbi:MAG: hypothetical protein ACOX60_06345 [Massiliimalia sp.]|jgi:hypothetical protein
MLDLVTIKKRYFSVILPMEQEDGSVKPLELDLESPKLKTVRKLQKLMSGGGDNTEALSYGVSEILSKNRQKVKITPDMADELDFDQMQEIFVPYMEWVIATKNQKN